MKKLSNLSREKSQSSGTFAALKSLNSSLINHTKHRIENFNIIIMHLG